MATHYAKRRRNERGHFLSAQAQAQLEAEEAAEQTPAGKSRRSREKMMQLARDRFKQGQEADDRQAKRERDDLRFYAGDQWPADVLMARQGQQANNGLPAVPARPSLVINKTREPVRQVLNQERSSDLGIELVPADDFEGLAEPIDETEIELREGLCRRIQRESQAADARTWAFARATIAGRGFYGVMTRFVPGKTWDQEIYVQRFYNQGSVTLDPAHEQPDGSDAEWGFVGTWMPWAEYKATFPSQARKRNVISAADPDDFQTMADEQPEWFKSDGELKSVYVTDYYYIERTSRELALLSDGSSAWVDELPEGTETTDTRTVIEKAVKWCKLDGANSEPLDETDWPGKYIPIVKVLGEELQPYDNERRCEGMVRPARSSQEGFNAMVSKWVEMVGLAPIPPFQATPEQVEGFESWYAVANTRTLPWLPYNSVTDGGERIGPPQRTPVSTDIAAIAGSVQMFDEAIQSTTGVPESRVGRNTDSHLKSGRALKELRESSEQGTSNYLDNLARSIRYEALIINDLLYPIYGRRPGRLARLMNAQGEAQAVLVGQPFTMDGKRPVAAPPGPPSPGQPPLPGVKEYKLTPTANFNVAVKVSRAFDRRREQEATMFGELISAEPMLMAWFGDLYFKHQDGPGHQEAAERAKVMLDPKIQKLLESKEQGTAAIPPQIQQAMAQGEQMIKALTQTVETLQKKLETDQIKSEATLKKAQMDGQQAIELQRMKDATAIRVAEINAMVKGLTIDHEHEADALAMAHETALGAADAAHEERMAQMGHEQALEAADQGLAGDAALADQSQGHALEQGQMGHQQAMEAQAMQPQPEAGA